MYEFFLLLMSEEHICYRTVRKMLLNHKSENKMISKLNMAKNFIGCLNVSNIFRSSEFFENL